MQWASQLQLEGVTHIIWANQKTSQSQVLYVRETLKKYIIWICRHDFGGRSLESSQCGGS